MTVLLLAAALNLSDIDCDLIRSKIAEYGRPKAIAWVLSHGYGWKDIALVKRKCRL